MYRMVQGRWYDEEGDSVRKVDRQGAGKSLGDLPEGGCGGGGRVPVSKREAISEEDRKAAAVVGCEGMMSEQEDEARIRSPIAQIQRAVDLAELYIARAKCLSRCIASCGALRFAIQVLGKPCQKRFVLFHTKL